MSEWTASDEYEHRLIVDELRKNGWPLVEANEEADKRISEIIARRARTSQDKGEPANG